MQIRHWKILQQMCEHGDGFECHHSETAHLKCDIKICPLIKKSPQNILDPLKQPTTRASRNAGGGKQSRPALRKALDVGQHRRK